jgi:hypothetical protein
MATILATIWLVYWEHYVLSNRLIPPEADDSYGYIAKSAQFEQDFMQQGNVANWLKAHTVTKTGDLQIDTYRYRTYHRLLYVFHPLYSAMLFTVKNIVGTWEKAYLILEYLGVVFLSVSLCIFLISLFPPLPALLAILTIPLWNIPGTGFLFIVPYTWAVIFGLLLLSFGPRLLNSNKWSWSLIIIGLICVGMHRLGVVYVWMFALISLIQLPRVRLPEILIIVTTSLTSTLIFFLGLFVKNPAFKMMLKPEANSNLLEDLKQNIVFALQYMDFLKLPGLGLIALILSLVSLVLYLVRGQWKDHITHTVILGTGILSVFHVLHGYPAEFLVRVFIPFAAIVVGILTTQISAGLLNMYKYPKALMPIVIFVALFAILAIRFSYKINMNRVHDIINRHDYDLSTSQIELIKNNLQSSSRIGFRNEVPLYFYLSHLNWNESNVVYFPILEGKPDVSNVHYLAFLGPLNKIPKQHFDLKDEVKIDFSQVDNNQNVNLKLSLEFVSNDQKSVLDYTILDSNDVRMNHKKSIQASDRFLTINAINKINSIILNKNSSLRLSGMQIDGLECDNLRWPWNCNVNVVYNESKIGFETEEVFSFPADKLKIIDDSGAIVLSEVISK